MVHMRLASQRIDVDGCWCNVHMHYVEQCCAWCYVSQFCDVGSLAECGWATLWCMLHAGLGSSWMPVAARWSRFAMMAWLYVDGSQSGAWCTKDACGWLVVMVRNEAHGAHVPWFT